MHKLNAGNERGSILLLTAFVLVAMLSVAALSVDASYMYEQRNRLSGAADAAAWAAAQELYRSTTANLQTYANHEVSVQVVPFGLTVASGPSGVVTCPSPSSGQVEVCVNSPPINGSFAGTAGYVEVIVSEPNSTFFSSVLSSISSFTVGARSVAGPASSAYGCVYALNTNGEDSAWTGRELDIDGTSANVSASGCALISNGGFNLDSGSSVTAAAISVTNSSGTKNGTATCPTTCPQYSQPQVPDPFAGMNETTLFGSAPWSGCTTTALAAHGYSYPMPLVTSGSFTYSGGQFYCRGCTATLYPGTYCGNGSSGGPGTDVHAIDIDGNATITYAGSSTAPYILDGGGLWEQHTVATGTNVTWYFTSDSTHAYEPCGGVEMNIDPTSPNTLTLSAPTSGPYTGLLMVRDRSSAICTDNAPEIELQPNTANLTGVVYFPYDHLQYCSGAASSSPYTVLIGGTVEMQGGDGDDCQSTTYINPQTSYTGAGYSSSPIKRTATAE